MKHLITFTLAALLASTAYADSSLSPEEFFDAQAGCLDSRQPEECFIARYRNATEAQTTWLVNKFADDYEEADSYAAANALRETYDMSLNIMESSPGRAFERGMQSAKLRLMMSNFP